jgi:hypothetical protein
LRPEHAREWPDAGGIDILHAAGEHLGMVTCACERWVSPLRDWSDAERRMASLATKDLMPTLECEAQGNWVNVFRCRVCGQRWAQEFPERGGPCLYAIALDDPRAWLSQGPGLLARLEQDAEDRAFFDVLGEERSEPRCARPGCSHGAILLSIFCRVHHFEMVKRKACPFGG